MVKSCFSTIHAHPNQYSIQADSWKIITQYFLFGFWFCYCGISSRKTWCFDRRGSIIYKSRAAANIYTTPEYIIRPKIHSLAYAIAPTHHTSTLTHSLTNRIYRTLAHNTTSDSQKITPRGRANIAATIAQLYTKYTWLNRFRQAIDFRTLDRVWLDCDMDIIYSSSMRYF